MKTLIFLSTLAIYDKMSEEKKEMESDSRNFLSKIEMITKNTRYCRYWGWYFRRITANMLSDTANITIFEKSRSFRERIATHL